MTETAGERRGMWDRNALEREADAAAAQAGQNDRDRYQTRFAADAALDRATADAEAAKWVELERWEREAVGQDDAWLDRIYAAYHLRVAAARAVHREAVAAAEARFAAADAALDEQIRQHADLSALMRPATTEESRR